MGLRRALPRISTPAFSLVEIAMALGLFAFAVIGIVGLLPVALETHRAARQDTVLAQIGQRLSAEVLQTDFSKLSAVSGVIRYFDEQGIEVAPGSGSARIYSAKVQVANLELPDEPAYASASARRVELYVRHDPAGSGTIDAADLQGAVFAARNDPETP